MRPTTMPTPTPTRSTRLGTVALVALVVTACSTSGSSPADTPDVAPSTAPSTTDTPPTTAAPDPTTTETIDQPARTAPTLVLDMPAPQAHLPMASGPDGLVVYEPPLLVTHTADGTRTFAIPGHAPGVGEFVDVSSIVRWGDRYWAFLVGDLTTGLGTASALVSPDGQSWSRVEIGSGERAGRVSGGLATPDVPQYEGTSGVQTARGSDAQLVAAGWTRTEAGVQPIVWATTDGTTWSTTAPSSGVDDRVLAAAVAPNESEVLVHTLAGTYAGQRLVLIGDDGERDVSLVGEQVVGDIARSGSGFLLASHAFFTPPIVLWEWDDGAWIPIEHPALAARIGDDAELRPFLLAGSPDGAVAAGDHELAIRREGRWDPLGSVRGTIVSVQAVGGLVRVVSGDASTTLITEVPTR